MARNTGPKCRRCRRAGMKLFLKGEKCINNCPLDKDRKVSHPGMHRFRRKLTGYALQLMEKQKTRDIYGVLEAQFRRYVDDAERRPGVTGHTLVRTLERRLDNVVYRAGFATSRTQARQWICHGHFQVNGVKTNIPSCLLSDGATIALRKNSRLAPLVGLNLKRSKEMGLAPPWISMDAEKKEAAFLRTPERNEVLLDIQDRLIVEFYTR
ncbi:MAG: 30S ribosomal protein S4 [bacterium]